MLQTTHDLRSAARSLRRRPLYPILSVVILSLGLSASVAVFTYVNGFFQPFPGVNAQGLVRVFGMVEDDQYQNISYLDFQDYANASGAFEGIAAVQPYYAASVRRETMTEVAFLEAVSGNYFSVLGVETTLGRGIAADDDSRGAPSVAVISHDWWTRSFEASPSVLGTTLYLNYRPFTIVGVAAPEFLGSAGDFRPNVWIPIAPFSDRYVGWTAQAENRDVPLVRVYGRLGDGANEQLALAELSTIAEGLDELYPSARAVRQLRLDAATWIDPRSRLAEWPTVRLMLWASFGLLLLVLANVGNLLLSVFAGRQRELTVRAALGASPGRLVRGVLLENVLLSGAAGVVAIVLAGPASARLGSYFARPSVWGETVARVATVDLRVIAFAVAVSVLTGLLAGLLPAIRASRRDLLDTLKTDAAIAVPGARRIGARRIPGVHDLLVSLQVALSVVLLVVAGLVLRTLASVGTLDPGFDYEGLVASHVSTSSTGVTVEGRRQWFPELARRIQEEPWVRSATIADNALLSPHPSMPFRLEGSVDSVPLVYSRVLPDFFDDVGIHVVDGRGFTAADTAGAPDVAVVSETLARRFFSDQQPIGRRVWWPDGAGGERSFEIVGVVNDVKTRDFLAEHEPTVFLSFPQHNYGSGAALHIASTMAPRVSVPLIYQWLREYEPHLAIVNVLPYTEVVKGFLYTQRMNAELFSALAFLALGLAAVGIFSVMTLAVRRRTREIAIRMAIGARAADIGRMILAKAMTPVAVGLVVGLLAALGAGRLARNLLFGVEPADPVTMLMGAATLVLAAMVAAYLPARRAAATDPMTSLRRD